MLRAAIKNAVDVMRCLYHSGASLDTADSEGETPIFAAVRSDKKEAAILLLGLGANAAHVNGKKRTLLHNVAYHASFETMLSLTTVVVRGLDATAQDQQGFTAQQSLEKRQPDSKMRAVFARLVASGADPRKLMMAQAMKRPGPMKNGATMVRIRVMQKMRGMKRTQVMRKIVSMMPSSL
ncbi:hypothetical protein F4803DRAFT_553807 [Xylaria telfairii]|nr:hypothetical protein F4803DRAFT_553807 [Xylaria telfairii]